MPTINFYIPSFTNHLGVNMSLVQSLEQHSEWYYDDIRIASMYGSFPNAIWNGGRCEFGEIDIPRFKDIIDHVNALGIAIRFTFTNCLIKEEHLSDEYCNRLMNLCDNGMNEVLVNSPVLEKYLRSNYPGFRYILSTTALIRGADSINEACNHYDLVVADYRDAKYMRFLQEITQRGKVEILLNEACVLDCKYRSNHYERISQSQLLLKDVQEEKNCMYHDTSKFREAYISKDTLYGTLVPMGYRHFKLRGRELSPDKLIKEYLMYLAKPQYQKEICYDLGRVLA